MSDIINDLAQADEYYDAGEYGKALPLYQRAAEAGHSEGQFGLGVCYEEGTGVEKDAAAAIRWYEKAARQDHPSALYNLGNLYFQGEEVEEDEEKAADFFQRAAELGDDRAMFLLGRFYEIGIGVTEDMDKAAEWIGKAAELGHEEAQAWLDGGADDDDDEENEDVALADEHYDAGEYGKAFPLYRKAAEAGDGYAQYMLAGMYEAGEGTKQDAKQAAEWYKKAAASGVSEAQHDLGCAYRDGEGVKKNIEKAIYWFEKAIEQENPYAMRDMGELYLEGKGVEQDEEKAVEYFKESAALECADAMYRLGLCFEEGRGVERDMEQAALWMKKAAELDDEDAQEWLDANAPEDGEPADDEPEAEEEYEEEDDAEPLDDYSGAPVDVVRKAAESGAAPAMYELGVRYCDGDEDSLNEEFYEFDDSIERQNKMAAYWIQKAIDAGYDTEDARTLLQGIKFSLELPDKMEEITEAAAQAEREEREAEEKSLAAHRFYDAGDYENAVKLFKQIVELKYAGKYGADAAYGLGLCYLGGRGVPEDYEQSKKWFTASRDRGHEGASETLEDMLVNEVKEKFQNGMAMYEKGDYGKAVAFWKEVAESSVKMDSEIKADAACNIGICYMSNNANYGWVRDYTQARKWFMFARDLGMSDAAARLEFLDRSEAFDEHQKKANMYIRNGQDREALPHTIWLAEAGSDEWQLTLGISYLEGIGTSYDTKKAQYWLKKSMEQGNKDAEKILRQDGLL